MKVIINHLILLLITLSLQAAYAQDVSPTLKGNVNISIKKGTVECDFELSNMPDIQNYVIRINSGMNIRYFRDINRSKKSLYFDIDRKDTTSSGESLAYYLHENIGNKGRYLPEKIALKYGGMYPVITDSLSGYMSEDWRGNVAFNGYSLRADGFQSAWYPVLYDMKKQIRYEKVNYDINLSCADCTVLFINGSKPVKAKSAHFITDKPQEMAIYCGNFKVADIDGTWLLNPDMDKSRQKEFGSLINTYKNYYQNNLGIPYKENITFIQTTQTAPDHAFSFVAYPSIINVGAGHYGLNAMFDKNNADHEKPVMAHELAHYYFGTYLRLNTAFGPIIDEGFAEYLSFKVTKNLISDSIYQDKIKSKIRALKFFNARPIAFVKNKDDLNNREYYVYYYTPVILTAIEKEIGEPTMWLWLKKMLTTKANFTDYIFFEKTFDAAIANKDEAERLKNKYFRSDNALKEAIEELSKK